MSEWARYFEPDPLNLIQLHDRTLREWHRWAATDHARAEWIGNEPVPVPLYGETYSECAWWALAAEYLYTDLTRKVHPPEVSVRLFMAEAVNGVDTLGIAVLKHWYAVPPPLKQRLGPPEKIGRLPIWPSN